MKEWWSDMDTNERVFMVGAGLMATPVALVFLLLLVELIIAIPPLGIGVLVMLIGGALMFFSGVRI